METNKRRQKQKLESIYSTGTRTQNNTKYRKWSEFKKQSWKKKKNNKKEKEIKGNTHREFSGSIAKRARNHPDEVLIKKPKNPSTENKGIYARFSIKKWELYRLQSNSVGESKNRSAFFSRYSLESEEVIEFCTSRNNLISVSMEL